jgi:hypothetical protein
VIKISAKSIGEIVGSWMPAMPARSRSRATSTLCASSAGVLASVAEKTATRASATPCAFADATPINIAHKIKSGDTRSQRRFAPTVLL